MKKIFSVLLAAVLAAGALAGCGGAPSSSAAQPAAASAAAQAEDVVLTVYAGTFPMKETVDQLTADYKAQTGVTVEWEIPGDEPYTLLKTRFAANDAPDIFEISSSDFTSWGVRCLDLSGEPWIGHVDAAALAGGTRDGKILGLPTADVGNGIVYNKELFAKAGIEKVPETLSELEETCKTLQAAGIQPFGEAFKEWGFLMHIFSAPLSYEQDPEAFCAELNAGTKTLGDLAYIDNFFRLYDLTLDYGKGAESVGYSASDQIVDFAAGKMAMIKQGTWYGDALWTVNPDLKIGLFAVPLTDNAADTKLMTSTASYYCIANTTGHEKEAKAFLNWLYENAQKYIVEGLKVASPYDNVDFTDLGSLYEDMQTYYDKGKTVSFSGENLPAGFLTDIATPLQSYAAGMLDQQGAVDALQAAYENRVAATGN